MKRLLAFLVVVASVRGSEDLDTDDFLADVNAGGAWTVVSEGTGICDGVNKTSAAKDLLRGKHLRIMEMVWAPMAVKDESSPYGWVGLDVDLLELLSARLGFTFELVDMGYPLEDETYTDLAFRVVNDGDLIASYWAQTPARRDRVTQLLGHIDFSAVLVSHPREPPEASFGATYFAFLRPFTPALWLVFLSCIMLSGFVDYLLERTTGAQLEESMYEAWAGALWGGFDYPKSPFSAAFQVVVAFCFLIGVAAYTAELAAFLTIERADVLSVSSLSTLDELNLPACTGVSDPNNPVYARLYPEISFAQYQDNAEGARKLVSGDCAALIAPQIQVWRWNTEPANCQLATMQTVLRNAAGWITHRGNWCVQAGLEYTLQSMINDGEIEDALRKWLPTAQCEVGSSGEAEEETEEESRRLEQVMIAEGRHASGPDRASRARADPPFARRRRRRLKGASSSSAGAAAGATAALAGGESDSKSLGVREFAGLFAVWASAAVLLLLLSCITAWCKRQKAREKAPGRERSSGIGRLSSSYCSKKATRLAAGLGVSRCLDTLLGEQPAKQRTDDEAVLLQQLLDELQDAHSLQRKSEGHMQEQLTKVMAGLELMARRDAANDAAQSPHASQRQLQVPRSSTRSSALGVQLVESPKTRQRRRRSVASTRSGVSSVSSTAESLDMRSHLAGGLELQENPSEVSRPEFAPAPTTAPDILKAVSVRTFGL